MPACPACGQENPEIARFCLACGAPLRRASSALQAEERKVVSVLFCDLVGFTGRAESADPEDVRDILRAYHGRLKREIERFGGTVEKFIGDAVMAVFGAPIAHEDDPERAVRCGQAILQAIDELNRADPHLRLAVRVGINTGETLVTTDAKPEMGEGMVAGDVVNTAARLQAAAPVGSVVVGAATRAATDRIFEYRALEPVVAKGKEQPLGRWQPVRNWPSDPFEGGTPFVGRDTERTRLRHLLNTVTADRRPAMAAIIGEPGAGKSRLLAELRATIPAGSANWRHGRCLPYGDGVSFWALGEVVKSQAEIFDGDPAETVRRKLDEALPPDFPDRDWVLQRIGPLVGLEAPRADRDESFAAWRRFIASLAVTKPAVVAIEDLHWADDALMAFLQDLPSRLGPIPVLILCTARPEVLARRPEWVSNLGPASMIHLSGLSEGDIGRVAAALLGVPELSEEIAALVVNRAEGNPLYAEQVVRLLIAHRALEQRDGTLRLREDAVIRTPEGIRAIIAARLDTLPGPVKQVAQDAAVVGRAFWTRAVAAIGDRDPVRATAAIDDLTRVGFVRPSPTSTIEGEDEFWFGHVLVRDEAYGQIPRMQRSDKHVAALRWLVSVVAGRLEDLAEVLAHHATTALELARAARKGAPTELESLALRYLLLAGDRVRALDVGRAVVHYRRALDLAPPGHPERVEVLGRLAEAVQMAGTLGEAAELLSEGIALRVARGEPMLAAELELRLAMVETDMGRWPEARERLDDLIEKLRPGSPSRPLATAYGQRGFPEYGETYAESVGWANRSLELTDELDLPDVRARSLGVRGLALANLGDPRGVDDLREALSLSLDLGLARDAYMAFANLTWALSNDDPPAALEVTELALAYVVPRGLLEGEGVIRAHRLEVLFLIGRWHDVLGEADALIEAGRTHGRSWTALNAAFPKAWALSLMGRSAEAVELVDSLSLGDIDKYFVLLSVPRIRGLRLAGRLEEAADLVNASVTEFEEGGNPALEFLCGLTREAAALGRADLVERCQEIAWGDLATARHGRHTVAGIQHELRGQNAQALRECEKAEQGWAGFGNPYEQGEALLGRSRCLIAMGRGVEAVGPLHRAREIFTALGAAPSLAEAEGLIQRAWTSPP